MSGTLFATDYYVNADKGNDVWDDFSSTLWVQNGMPYMVFCHEEVQTGNGEMNLAEMSPDFTRFVADIEVLFVMGGSRVTDGPCCSAPKRAVGSS